MADNLLFADPEWNQEECNRSFQEARPKPLETHTKGGASGNRNTMHR
jgi:hypothetical protein